eukprot:31008-Pelagococcus_subviridis.AAC.3
MSTTAALVVNIPWPYVAIAEDAIADASPRHIADASSISEVLIARREPSTGGKKVCAACDTPSPMTAKKK